MRKATKVLLTELVGQCNIFLAFKMMEPSLVISVYNAVQDKETLFLLPTCTAVWEIPSVLTCVLKIFYPYHIKVDEPEALSVLRSIKIIKNQWKRTDIVQERVTTFGNFAEHDFM